MPSRRAVSTLAACGFVVAVAAVLLVRHTTGHGDPMADSPVTSDSPGRPLTSSPAISPTPTVATSAAAPVTRTAAPTPSPTKTPATRDELAAAKKLADLVEDSSEGSTSVAAVDLTTGRSVHAGATSGMTLASVAKVQLLETLLLERARTHTALTAKEKAMLTRMVEQSSNADADATYYDIGGRSVIVADEPTLGLTKKTVAGPGVLWGLGTSTATDQIALLRNLVSTRSPLDADDRAYALSLMRHVESDQQWGAPVVADDDTHPAVKNGWLAVSSDDNRWAVNSLGVVTVDGQTVLMAVMTQHGASFDGGIDRVEDLAKVAATAAAG